MRLLAILVGTVGLLVGATACGETKPKLVPEVTGERLDVAEDLLDDVGLRYRVAGGGAFGVVVRSHWTVCAQSPRPGRKGRVVRLTVARLCPVGAVIPDVSDQPLDEAEEELEELGIAYEVDSLGEGPVLIESLWTVCSQWPGPGERAREVELYVSHECWDDWYWDDP